MTKFIRVTDEQGNKLYVDAKGNITVELRGRHTEIFHCASGSVKRLFDAFWTRNENATPATDEEVAEEVADIRAGGMAALNDPLVARDRLRPEDVREVGLGTGPPTGPPEFALAA